MIDKEGGRRDKKPVDEAKRRVGLFALKCMAQLLVAMPHFNYAKNMVHALIPFTAHKVRPRYHPRVTPKRPPDHPSHAFGNTH